MFATGVKFVVRDRQRSQSFRKNYSAGYFSFVQSFPRDTKVHYFLMPNSLDSTLSFADLLLEPGTLFKYFPYVISFEMPKNLLK